MTQKGSQVGPGITKHKGLGVPKTSEYYFSFHTPTGLLFFLSLINIFPPIISSSGFALDVKALHIRDDYFKIKL